MSIEDNQNTDDSHTLVIDNEVCFPGNSFTLFIPADDQYSASFKKLKKYKFNSLHNNHISQKQYVNINLNKTMMQASQGCLLLGNQVAPIDSLLDLKAFLPLP